MGRTWTIFVCLLALLTAGAWVLAARSGPAWGGQEDLLVADFEQEGYGDWQAEGEAFGPGPAQGTLPQQMPVTGFQGRRLVNSYYGGDGTTGTLTSPPFILRRRYLPFLIGNGRYLGETCMNLLIAGQVVRTATGANDRPGGSERFDWQGGGVAEWVGRTAVLPIGDRRTGGWGHPTIDCILQGDDATRESPMLLRGTYEEENGGGWVVRWLGYPPFIHHPSPLTHYPSLPFSEEKSVEIQVNRRYLNLLVQTGATMRRVRLLRAGEVVREFEIELAEGEPDFWTFLDLNPFQGQTLTLEVDGLLANDRLLQAISQDDAIRGAQDLYRERYRPQFHFSSRRGWNNDPNGLVYYKGEYHLFYQHNPYGWNWGNMHWGHAVSPDLVHWRELPIALYPQAFGDWCFSGSAAVDWGNTGGFKEGEEDVIVAAFTSTGRGECLRFSRDRGRTFQEYPGNPVVRHQGRDPKILWYAPGRHWVMAVYDEQDEARGIAFYTSPDLKQWTFASRIEGYFECPELFEIGLDGDPHDTRWVVYSGDGAYSVGRFDGRMFTAESGKHRLNWGNCFYASQTFNDIPAEDGRRIQIAWGTVAHPGMPFNQMMDFPVELTLRTTEEGPRLFVQPVREIALLHRRAQAIVDRPLREGDNPLAGMGAELLHLRAELEPGTAAELGLVVRGTSVLYRTQSQELTCLGQTAPLNPVGGAIRLELLVDRTSIEIYANDGRVYMPMGIIHPEANHELAAFSRGGEGRIRKLEAFELASAWE